MRRPNYFENRYNQWVIAGKIALQTHAIDDRIYKANGELGEIYTWNDDTPHYSMIGQEYLAALGISIKEL